MGEVGDFHCQSHAKMVHKTELQWVLGVLLLVISGTLGYVAYSGASKDQISAVEKSIVYVERQVERDREEFRENQREIAKELRELNVYIRNVGSVK